MGVFPLAFKGFFSSRIFFKESFRILQQVIAFTENPLILEGAQLIFHGALVFLLSWVLYFNAETIRNGFFQLLAMLFFLIKL